MWSSRDNTFNILQKRWSILWNDEGCEIMGVIIYAGDDKDFRKGDFIVMQGEMTSAPTAPAPPPPPPP